MRIQNFEDFSKNLNEEHPYSYYTEPEGKTAFSKWLRGINQKLKYANRETMGSRPRAGEGGLGPVDTYKKSKEAVTALPGLVRLITGAGAAIADFFTPAKKGQKISKSEVKTNKKKLLDDWEERELGGKTIGEHDAENFYKSGVLRGQQYFGQNFNPLVPRNKNEKDFSDYLQGAMKRYYGRIDKTRKPH